MTTFDKREQGFESKFVHDEEIRFKAKARSSKLLGIWASEKLGLAGDAAETYARSIVTSDLGGTSTDAILDRLSKDLAPKGVSRKDVEQKMQEYLHIALEQIESGK